MTDDGTDCVPSPQPQTRKEGVKRENKREKGREPNLIYLCMSILGLLWHSRFLSPTESTSQMFYHLLYTCPVGQSRITGSFQTVFRFLTVQYFSVWLQCLKHISCFPLSLNKLGLLTCSGNKCKHIKASPHIFPSSFVRHVEFCNILSWGTAALYMALLTYLLCPWFS